jgi:hypothetical protein
MIPEQYTIGYTTSVSTSAPQVAPVRRFEVIEAIAVSTCEAAI